MNKTEEQFYAIAAQEVAFRNVSPGVMAKALVDADGDEKRTIVNYIRLRVAQQKEAFDAQVAEQRRKQEQEDRILAEENKRLQKHRSRW